MAWLGAQYSPTTTTMTSSVVPRRPYKLVTVNTAPERAQRLIGRLVEALKDRYTIIHAANCESMPRPSLSRPKLTFLSNRSSRRHRSTSAAGSPGTASISQCASAYSRPVNGKPQFCASVWTSEEAAEIQTIARRVKSDIATYALPQGLQVQQGPDAVVDHLKCMVPQVLQTYFGEADSTHPK